MMMPQMSCNKRSMAVVKHLPERMELTISSHEICRLGETDKRGTSSKSTALYEESHFWIFFYKLNCHTVEPS